MVSILSSLSCSGATTSGFADVRNWGYQLQKIDVEKIAASDFDVIIVDYSRDGTGRTEFSREDVARMKSRIGKAPRYVLAYISIGEAESYRYYWQRSWENEPPEWLSDENPDWPGNYVVRYWDPEWQKIIFEYIDKVIAAGFDGVYLDRVDAYLEWPGQKGKKKQAMIAFVTKLAAKARAARPGFLIVPQNGEELLRSEAYLSQVDGIAKEDLLFDEHGRRESDDSVRTSLHHLDLAKAHRLPVFVVEYVQAASKIATARKRLEKLGLLPYFAPRQLDRLVQAGSVSHTQGWVVPDKR